MPRFVIVDWRKITVERKRCLHYRKLFKSTLNNRLHRNLACVIDKSSRGAKLKRAFEELPIQLLPLAQMVRSAKAALLITPETLVRASSRVP